MFVVRQIAMQRIQVGFGRIGPTQNPLYTFQWRNQGMDGVSLEVDVCFLTRPSWVGREVELNWPFGTMFMQR